MTGACFCSYENFLFIMQPYTWQATWQLCWHTQLHEELSFPHFREKMLQSYGFRLKLRQGKNEETQLANDSHLSLAHKHNRVSTKKWLEKCSVGAFNQTETGLVWNGWSQWKTTFILCAKTSLTVNKHLLNSRPSFDCCSRSHRQTDTQTDRATKSDRHHSLRSFSINKTKGWIK